MSFRKALGVSVLTALLFSMSAVMAGSVGPVEVASYADLSELEARVAALEAAVFGSTTTTVTESSTTEPSTTTSEQSTTTTAAETTTTQAATTTTRGSSFVADQCVLDQIAREPFKQSREGPVPKSHFDIMITQINDDAPGTPLWEAPYLVDLGNGYGWISGDRAGYHGAYMFLVHREEGRVLARVFFRSLSGAGYMKVNDRYMDEIQTTNLGYDGTCSATGSQSESPEINEVYAPDNGPEVRPLIPILVNGVEVENRSYTNTATPGTDVLRFSGLGRITEPFTTNNGTLDSPHTVYERQAVGARVNINGEFVLSLVVYYDILDPSASFG